MIVRDPPSSTFLAPPKSCFGTSSAFASSPPDIVLPLLAYFFELLKALPRTVDGIFFPVRSISSFEKAFARAVKRAKIEDFHMHDIRHCGAQHLIEDEGWNTIELMQQGGWTSSSMAKRYANISPKYLAKKFGN